MKNIKKEQERIKLMSETQYDLSEHVRFCFGIDEAGRGALCGPVCAACCLFERETEILYLDDSKKLSAKKREILFENIREKALAYGIFFVDAARIDAINVLNATLEAMKGAFGDCLLRYKSKYLEKITATDIESLKKSFDDIPGLDDSFVLVDGNTIVPGIFFRQKPVIKGDTKCPSICAASILAKVSRDHLMLKADTKYPEYGFAKNKGYGTKEHIDALKKYGPIQDFHRKNFIKNFIRF